ncbi:MAG: winged helix-turn-helix transcriptional regulator [Nanoarchaeota archaeon]
MIKIDAYDKKILEILLENSRKQISTIGKNIRLRRENVNYKINRLIKLGLIKEFNTILNEELLGLSHYVVFLELAKLQEDTEKRILEYLKENKFMSWIGTSAGRWSLVFDIVISQKAKLDKILNDLLINFGEFIEDYVVLKLHGGDYFASKMFGVVKRRVFNHAKTRPFKLDNKDLEILSLLNKDSRISLVSISEKVKLTPNGVNHRIKNMENKGVFIGYTISLDWKKLDYEWYDIQIKLIKFGEEVDKELSNYFREHKSIVFYYKYLGGVWDYDLGLIVKNSNELREFINNFRKTFPDIAKISDVFLVLEETTGYKLPNGVFE